MRRHFQELIRLANARGYRKAMEEGRSQGEAQGLADGLRVGQEQAASLAPVVRDVVTKPNPAEAYARAGGQPRQISRPSLTSAAPKPESSPLTSPAKEKLHPRLQTVKEQASKFNVAEGRTEKLDHNEIEELMTRGERNEMEDHITSELADVWSDYYDNDYDNEIEIDEADAAGATGWSDHQIHARFSNQDIPREVYPDRDDDFHADLADHIRQWYHDTDKHGPDAIDELYDHLYDGGYPELADHIYDWKHEAKSDMQEAIDNQRRDQIDSLVEEAVRGDSEGYSEVRRNYLDSFFRDNQDDPRFKLFSHQPNQWIKDSDGNMEYKFESTSGDNYLVSVTNTESGNITSHDIAFANKDKPDSFGVTGSGGAHSVFAEVMPALSSAVSHLDSDIFTFSASGGRQGDKLTSRQRLYDRMVTTLAQLHPEYKAIAIQFAGGTRQYLIIKRDRENDIRQEIQSRIPAGVQVETIVKSMPVVASWFTPQAWVMPRIVRKGEHKPIRFKSNSFTTSTESVGMPRNTETNDELIRQLLEEAIEAAPEDDPEEEFDDYKDEELDDDFDDLNDEEIDDDLDEDYDDDFDDDTYPEDDDE